MITHIVKNEWKLLSRERILYIALPIYLLMLAYGVLSGTGWKHSLQSITSEAQLQADTGFNNKLKKLDRILAGEPYAYAEDPRLPAQLARYQGYEMATKPPSATAAIAIGQSDVVPSYLKVQWKPMFKQTNTDEVQNPQILANGAFDLGFVLIYLYPLLIIALSYNVLSAERESGTQILLLSQPVSVGQFVIGKLVLRGLLIIGGAALISIVGLLLMNPDIIAAHALWRVGLLGVVLFLYGLFWFGLAVLVNALGKKSATNALIMMAIWITLVLVVPSALNLVAKSLYPLPSRIEMVQALRNAEAQAVRETKFDRSYRADLLRKGEEEALEASNTEFYLKVLPLEQQAEAIASPIFARFEEQRRAQQLLADKLKYVSPAVIAQIALNELANHSAENFNDFGAQVASYHQVWRSYFLKPVMEGRSLTKQEMIDIPRFAYRSEPTDVVQARLVSALFALLIFPALIFALGFLYLRRYSPAAR